MFRNIGTLARGQARNHLSYLMRSGQANQNYARPGMNFTSQFGLTKQNITPTDQHDKYQQSNDNQHDKDQKSQPLHAKFWGPLFIPLGLLIYDKTLDFKARTALMSQMLNDIEDQPTWEKSQEKFFEIGGNLLARATRAKVHAFRDWVVYKPELEGRMKAVIFTSPDPEVENGMLVICLGTLDTLREDESYECKFPDGTRFTDAVFGLIAQTEALAARLPGSPKTRGGLVLLEEDKSWAPWYWDGKRWIDFKILDWQTVEDLRPYIVMEDKK